MIVRMLAGWTPPNPARAARGARSAAARGAPSRWAEAGGRLRPVPQVPRASLAPARHGASAPAPDWVPGRVTLPRLPVPSPASLLELDLRALEFAQRRTAAPPAVAPPSVPLLPAEPELDPEPLGVRGLLGW